MLPVRVERRRNLPSRWTDPLSDLDLVGNFDRMVDRIFGMRGGLEGATSYYPADIWEDEENVHVELELPGLKADQVNVSFEDGMLRIEGESKIPERKGTVYVSERSYGKFIRTFQLPTTVDPNNIKAHFHDGLLEITCAKKPETKPHRIEIRPI